MRREFKQRQKLVVYLDAEDYAKLREIAGGNISAYVRHRIFTPEVDAGKGKVNLSVVEEIPKEAIKGKTCMHGTAKGYNCWMCGGLAEVK